MLEMVAYPDMETVEFTMYIYIYTYSVYVNVYFKSICMCT